MATIGSIVIGVRVATRELSAGLATARAQVASFAGQVATAAKGMAVAPLALGALGGAALGAGLIAVVRAGSDLNEVLSKTGVVFGASKDVVTAGANEMAAKYGIVRTTFLEAASELGQIGKASGLTEAAAAGLSVELVKLGTDVSSIGNKDLPQVLAAIKSGLVGEAEPLRAFGVLLSESAVKARAAQLGIAAFGAELTESQKVQARASLIQEQLGYALGDLERTSGGAANAFRQLLGRVQNFAADVGLALQPLAEGVLRLLNTAFASLGESFTGKIDAVREWAEGVASAGGTVMRAWSLVGQGLGLVADVVHTVGLGFQAAQVGGLKLGAAIAQGISLGLTALQALRDTLVAFLRSVDALGKKAGLDLGLADMVPELDLKGAAAGFADQAAALAEAAKTAWGDFLVELAKPPPSEGINDWFAEIRKKAEAAMAAAKDAANAPAPAAAAAGGPALADLKKEQERKKKLAENARKFGEELRGPFDKLALKFAEIDDVVSAGLLDSVDAEALKRKEAGDLVGKNTKAGAGAVDARSAEAFNAIVAYQTSRQDPLRALPDLTRLGVREQERQTSLLERIARFLGEPAAGVELAG